MNKLLKNLKINCNEKLKIFHGKGQKQISAMHICTHKYCKSDNKWVCADCSFESLHQHG